MHVLWRGAVQSIALERDKVHEPVNLGSSRDAGTASASTRGVTVAVVLILAALVGYAGEVHAAGLVGNVGQPSTDYYRLHQYEFTQAFTTGTMSNGYTLSSIEIQFDSATSNPSPNIEVWKSPAGGFGTLLGTLTTPATLTAGSHYTTFDAGEMQLEASVRYLLYVRGLGNQSVIRGTDSDDEDAGSAQGWSIADQSSRRNRFPVPGDWNSYDAAMKIRINGTANNVAAAGKPTIVGTAQAGTEASVTTAGISDANGLDSVSFVYQWVRVDPDGRNRTNIPGAHSTRYTPVAADAGKVRGLVAHEDDGYREWGASGSVTVQPGEGGRGLSLSVGPVWGETASGTGRLWAARDARDLESSSAFEAEGRVEAKMGYGVALTRGRGLVTPYAGLTLAGEGKLTCYRTGARWDMAPGVALGVEGRQSGGSIELRLRLGW